MTEHSETHKISNVFMGIRRGNGTIMRSAATKYSKTEAVDNGVAPQNSRLVRRQKQARGIAAAKAKSVRFGPKARDYAGRL